jgi:U3 small nucleolar RNA-associated protein 11
MSSLRNAVKRITHKERSQPQDRSHLGILEKKKDYQQRAKHYHAQQDRLKRLQERAAQRNPDEFYFGMQRSQVKNGKHTQAATKEKDDYRHLDPQLVRIMKDQDLKFVRMQQQQDSKAAAKLQASLHQLNNDDDEHSHHGRKHTVFVETQQQAQDFDVATHFDTLPELAHRSFNRLRKCNVEQIMAMATNNNNNHNNIVMNNGGGETTTTTTAKSSSPSSSKQKLALLKLQHRQQARQLAKAKELAYRELQARQNRARSLRLAEQHLVTEQLVASKGRKRKITAAENGQPAQYKWRRRRSK